MNKSIDPKDLQQKMMENKKQEEDKQSTETKKSEPEPETKSGKVSYRFPVCPCTIHVAPGKVVTIRENPYSTIDEEEIEYLEKLVKVKSISKLES